MQLGDYNAATPVVQSDPTAGGMGGNALAGGVMGGASDPWSWLTQLLAQYGINPQGQATLGAGVGAASFDARFGALASRMPTPGVFNALQRGAVVPPAQTAPPAPAFGFGAGRTSPFAAPGAGMWAWPGGASPGAFPAGAGGPTNELTSILTGRL
jgi:hypothetical protein